MPMTSSVVWAGVALPRGGDAGGYRGETMASARPAGLGRDQRRLLIDGASTRADAAPSLQRNAQVGLRESAAM